MLLVVNPLLWLGLAMFGHAALDRMLGYGLKFPTPSAHPPGWIGRQRAAVGIWRMTDNDHLCDEQTVTTMAAAKTRSNPTYFDRTSSCCAPPEPFPGGGGGGAGCGCSSWSGYENGTAEPPFDLLLRVSDYFKVSTDKLLKYDLTDSASQLSSLERGWDIDLWESACACWPPPWTPRTAENVELVPEKGRLPDGLRGSPRYIQHPAHLPDAFLSRDKKYRTFQISGDSMPPVNEGAWVSASTCRTGTPSRRPALHRGHQGGGIVFQVVYDRVEGEGQPVALQHQPAVPALRVPVGEVLEVWKFVHYISPELPEPNLTRRPEPLGDGPSGRR